jgi:hypothetical protein
VIKLNEVPMKVNVAFLQKTKPAAGHSFLLFLKAGIVIF